MLAAWWTRCVFVCAVVVAFVVVAVPFVLKSLTTHGLWLTTRCCLCHHHRRWDDGAIKVVHSPESDIIINCPKLLRLLVQVPCPSKIPGIWFVNRLCVCVCFRSQLKGWTDMSLYEFYENLLKSRESSNAFIRLGNNYVSMASESCATKRLWLHPQRRCVGCQGCRHMIPIFRSGLFCPAVTPHQSFVALLVVSLNHCALFLVRISENNANGVCLFVCSRRSLGKGFDFV